MLPCEWMGTTINDCWKCVMPLLAFFLFSLLLLYLFHFLLTTKRIPFMCYLFATESNGEQQIECKWNHIQSLCVLAFFFCSSYVRCVCGGIKQARKPSAKMCVNRVIVKKQRGEENTKTINWLTDCYEFARRCDRSARANTRP